jgi:hypothetical protein
MKNKDHIVEVESDKFFNNPDFVEHVSEWGDPQPVDINNAFVPIKGDAGNLAKTQENIRRRFNLGGEK